MLNIADPNQLWIVVTGFVISFVLAFGIGANDVANSFGTSVGSKVLTLRQACILATVFEIAGALLLGAKVSDTIRKGIIDPNIYADDSTDLLLVGLVSALGGSCIWLLIATFARVPVSGTHSIVGATVGFSLVAKGLQGVRWEQLGYIVASWFASPVLSAIVSVLLFYLIQRFVLFKDNPLEYGLRVLPLIYGITLVTNLYSIFYDGPPLLNFHYIPVWGSFVASFGIGLLCSVVVKFLVVPFLRVQIRRHCIKLRQKQALQEQERLARQAERMHEQEGAEPLSCSTTESELASGLASCEKADLLDHGKTPRVTFAGKLKSRFTRNRKHSGPSDDVFDVPKMDDLAAELPVCISRTPSDSCASLAAPRTSVEPSNSPRDPLISSCTQLPSVKTPVDSSVNPARCISTPKLDQSDKNRLDVVPKSSKFRVERIEQGSAHLNSAVRSACTSTTSIFREANKLDSAASSALSTATDEQHERLVPDETPDPDSSTTQLNSKSCGPKRKGSKPASTEVVDSPESTRLFSSLQVLTAIFGAFAHGGNDVSNAIGPLIGIWITASTGTVAGRADTPWWILLYGGAGISAGLWVWGRRVIQTLGEDLTKVTPSSGFCIELGAALTVLVASNARLPVSTTHCKVGSVVGVGRFRSRDNVDWRVFRNIILAWFVTVPGSAALSAVLMFGFMQLTRVSAPAAAALPMNSTLMNATTLF